MRLEVFDRRGEFVEVANDLPLGILADLQRQDGPSQDYRPVGDFEHRRFD